MSISFSAGPSLLPEPVLRETQQALIDWQGSGFSICTLPHRSKEFQEIAKRSEQDLRDLLSIPNHYRVLFLQGGARSQFAMVPMNLAAQRQKAAYLITGIWSQLACDEAQRYCAVTKPFDVASADLQKVAQLSTADIPADSAYVHYADNETIDGIEFPHVPQIGSVPLVCDMSSNLLSKPIDIERFGLIYASAQKNIGVAGITVVIIRDDLLQRQPFTYTPSMFRYAKHSEHGSMQNTPPTLAWYVAAENFKWLKRQGGLSAMATINARKAALLYEAIDASDYYQNNVPQHWRSRMNVVFTLPNAADTQQFLEQAQQHGLYHLRGHKRVGGIRASIYNAMPIEGVEKLVAFMVDFEKAK